jgi:hypothetical protein
LMLKSHETIMSSCPWFWYLKPPSSLDIPMIYLHEISMIPRTASCGRTALACEETKMSVAEATMIYYNVGPPR